ncbi:hypothetical protein MXB_2200 [Myxobolus squamalis]|nr:hypothetical protein MXB_2200 [Myxobolus squamalis]
MDLVFEYLISFLNGFSQLDYDNDEYIRRKLIQIISRYFIISFSKNLWNKTARNVSNPENYLKDPTKLFLNIYSYNYMSQALMSIEFLLNLDAQSYSWLFDCALEMFERSHPIHSILAKYKI